MQSLAFNRKIERIRKAKQLKMIGYKKQTLDLELMDNFQLSNNLECFALWIIAIPNPTAVKQINHIKFKNLVNLSLNGNNIISIQSLQWLDASELMRLELAKNKICYLKAFGKCYFRNLQSLNVNANAISQFDGLSKLTMGSFMCKEEFDYIMKRDVNREFSFENGIVLSTPKEVRRYRRENGIQIEIFDQDAIDHQISCLACSNLVWLFKLQSTNIAYLDIYEETRIKNQRIIASLQNKYTTIQICSRYLYDSYESTQ